MRTLRFIVDGQSIEQDPSCDFSGIVEGTKNYLKASFSFSEEWNGFVKVAEFKRLNGDRTVIPAPIVNGECTIPNITDCRRWCVRIVGKNGKTVLTSNTRIVTQERR